MTGVAFYMSGKAKKLQTAPQLIRNQTLAAVRRGTRVVRNEVHSEYVKRGIGRALFEGRGTRILGGSKLATIIKQGRSKWVGDKVETNVYAKGTAALVGLGGKTVAHDISPSRSKFINQSSGGVMDRKAMWRRIEFQKHTGNAAFGLKGALSNIARGGGFFSARTVRHPGSRFKKDDFLNRGASRAYPRFRAEVAKGMAKVAEIVNRG